ncbi:hypothetical protein AB751O23_BN_00070 [Chlamydiales bacterium SCGC AB-751-O23]|jgi:phosphoserine phosphatase|nr:hypothetical protein AB751O23_BN_00070 [Chlamydiales bacterium SCGC AB-751-O23]
MEDLTKESFDAIVFDGEGTLSSALPWQHLAQKKGVLLEVNNYLSLLSQGEVDSVELFDKLFKLLSPSLNESLELGRLCAERLVQDAKGLLHLFQSLGKQVFLLTQLPEASSVEFAQALGLAENKVFGIQLFYNSDGTYKDFDRHSLLVQQQGKLRVINHLKKSYKRLVYIGDGVDDLMLLNSVERFVGFGGLLCSETVAKEADFYLRCPTLAPLIYLCLTSSERGKLGNSQQSTLCQAALNEFTHKRITLSQKISV